MQLDMFDSEEDIVKKEIHYLSAEIERLVKLRDAFKLRLPPCKHEKVTLYRDYAEGGYDYTSTCDLVYKCDKCGAETERWPDPSHTPRYG